ncbi:hypothetical protein Ahy_B09g096158 isoform B [Arachis hypogaea]|nr:hypothetical protein Ahy_B09g096158 isoform B [Arachis hypogaea]
MWCVRASVDTGRQFNFNVPIEINYYGFYSIIGSDHGVICLRISMGVSILGYLYGIPSPERGVLHQTKLASTAATLYLFMPLGIWKIVWNTTLCMYTSGTTLIAPCLGVFIVQWKGSGLMKVHLRVIFRSLDPNLLWTMASFIG